MLRYSPYVTWRRAGAPASSGGTGEGKEESPPDASCGGEYAEPLAPRPPYSSSESSLGGTEDYVLLQEAPQAPQAPLALPVSIPSTRVPPVAEEAVHLTTLLSQVENCKQNSEKKYC